MSKVVNIYNPSESIQCSDQFSIVEFKDSISKPPPTNSFTGYSRVKKGRIFRSKTEEFLPGEREAPIGRWLEEEELTEQTKVWRELFPTYIRASYDFKFYQLYPTEISFIDPLAQPKIYRPLALLTFWDGIFSPKNRKSLLIDIRSDREIREKADFLIPAYRAAQRFSQRRKVRFKIFRDSFFRSDYFLELRRKYVGENKL